MISVPEAPAARAWGGPPEFLPPRFPALLPDISEGAVGSSDLEHPVENKTQRENGTISVAAVIERVCRGMFSPAKF